MTEYIEREAVISLFDANKWQGEICIDAVKEIPASSVVPVVRCKDCKYYEVDAGHVDGVMCLKHGHKWTIPKPDDFCSYAEKKS